MITPLDIENKKFGKQIMNGYNVDEVDDFLDEITRDYEKLYKENSDLKKSVEDANQEMEKYKNIENTLQNTLIMAQSAATEVKNSAKQQADQIVKDAELSAKTRVEELNAQIKTKEKELDDVRKQLDIYKAKMESLLISQLELIKDINKE